jgi:hypothetical protein
MQLFFIDESGTIPPKDKTSDINFFTLGGIVISEDLWYELDKELTKLKLRFNIVGEIKWRYFAPQHPNAKLNPLSHLTKDQKETLRYSIFHLIAKFKSIRLICALVDIESAYGLNYIQCQNDLYWHAYKEMTEKFQYYLKDLSHTVGNKINGIIICDHRQPKDDHQLRYLHQTLLTDSEREYSNYRNLIEGVFLAPSHFSVGIQLADMVAGAVYRNFTRQDSRYFDTIKQSLKVDGVPTDYSLIRWPQISLIEKQKRGAVLDKSKPASIDAVTA